MHGLKSCFAKTILADFLLSIFTERLWKPDGGAGDWTQSLMHAKRVFYHWATPTAYLLFSRSISKCFAF